MKTKLVHLLVAVAMVFSMVAVILAVPGAATASVNVPPTAQAGNDQVVHGIDYMSHAGPYPQVTLDGSASFDLNRGDTISYAWSEVSGPSATIVSPCAAITQVDLTSAGTYVFKLTVTDQSGKSDTDEVTVIAGLTWFVRICGNNSWDGTAYTFTGPSTGAWRTITQAINNPNVKDGDRIVVGPTPDPVCGGPDFYGGSANPEYITVNKSLTIWSKDGAGATTIDVSAQNGPGQVVEISADGVVFGCNGHGFTLTGAPVGIYAHDADYIYIHQNNVVVNGQCCNANEAPMGYTGIAVQGCKMPIVEDNTVEVCCADFGTGIVLNDCEIGTLDIEDGDYVWSGARVLDNQVEVDVDDVGYGIVANACPKALIDGNEVDVLVGPSAGWGIAVYSCEDVAVTNNTVVVDVDSVMCGVGVGIEVIGSYSATVAGNSVDVDVTISAACIGGLLGVGINVAYSPKSDVTGNVVSATGFGEVTNAVYVSLQEGINVLDADAVQALDEAMTRIIGQPVMALGAGLVAGIFVTCSDSINVIGNDVDAEAKVCIRSADHIAVGAGGVFALGITVVLSMAPDVVMNDVLADAYADVIVSASGPEPEAIGVGGGVAAGFGILTAVCWPDTIHGNTAFVYGNAVEAYGEVIAQVWAVDEGMGLDNPDSVLAVLDQNVLSAIYQVVTDSAENEETNVQVSGQPRALLTYAAGGAIGLGVGITTILCDGAQIVSNNPVVGSGIVDVTVVGLQNISADFVGALGGGLGLGIGILDVDCAASVVMDNGICVEPQEQTDGGLCGVIGYGEANVDVEAAVIEYDEDCAGAEGGSAGIGIGILVTGGVSLSEVEQAELPLSPTAVSVVVGNVVDADGNANLLVEAYDMRPYGAAFAMGESVAHGLGIVVTALGYCNISGNTVDAQANAIADVYSAGISAEDPVAMGASFSAAVGITAGVVLAVNEMVGNTVYAEGTAVGVSGAVEEAVLVDIQEASAFGTTQGVGIGILIGQVLAVSEVSQNQATGIGNADVTSIAVEMEPLELAWSCALACAVGQGISLTEILAEALVHESNTFEAGANVTVDAQAYADYAHPAALGYAAAIDAFFDVILGTVCYNYNDMPGEVTSSAHGWAAYDDLGVLAVGCLGFVDARYNWWGDATGPSGFGPGNGQAIVWCGVAAVYEPWLYVEHQICLDDHIGRFGFAIPLHTCWNTFSTPVALDESVDTFGELLSFSGLTSKVSIAYWFDAEAQQWVQVLAEDEIEPLRGMYIKMDACGNALLLTSTEETLPTNDLEPGWNLIGANPPFCWSSQCVNEAVSSIVDDEGCAFVLSPSVGGQDTWVWTPGSDCSESMEIGQAYWVWMNKADTLAGFGFTPVRDLYPCGGGCC